VSLRPEQQDCIKLRRSAAVSTTSRSTSGSRRLQFERPKAYQHAAAGLGHSHAPLHTCSLSEGNAGLPTCGLPKSGRVFPIRALPIGNRQPGSLEICATEAVGGLPRTIQVIRLRTMKRILPIALIVLCGIASGWAE